MTAEPAPAGEVLAGRIAAAIGAFGTLRPVMEAAKPLPPGANVAHDEDAWGPREVLAHVAEAVGYWHGEVERYLATDRAEDPSIIGRTVVDPLRAGVVNRDRTLPPEVLFGRLEREAAAMAGWVRGLSDGDLARRCTHRSWGDITVAAVLERTFISHVEGHVAQVRAPSDGTPG